ncbi:MazG family protein [Microbacterium sp. cf332]|uniref:MazG family protein n=1 Tax=Microbacterium sp. cf332 TaxID=1761804 RepID=UPI00088A49E2|nr:MazG family protein [Microbacterium sp. cf332]SDQ05614.1 XTP/dITP diphosphohydrolase [Microbacterium sp. cf332]
MSDPLRAAADTMRTVRDRCVWTAQISHRDLVPYLIEESAEVVDAVESGTSEDLREELGDLLWQVLFHAEIASRASVDPFDIDDVARGLTEKMVRRHPHVFAGETAETPEQVLVLWNAAKAAEKHSRTSVLEGVSHHMPTLALAQKLLAKSAAVPRPAKPHSRPETPAPTQPVGAQLGPRGSEGTEDGEAALGEALLGLVALARENGWDAERALRGRLRALEDEIRSAEAGRDLADRDAAETGVGDLEG